MSLTVKLNEVNDPIENFFIFRLAWGCLIEKGNNDYAEIGLPAIVSNAMPRSTVLKTLCLNSQCNNLQPLVTEQITDVDFST